LSFSFSYCLPPETACIIGLLAAFVGPKVFKAPGKARPKAAKVQIELFGQALDEFRLDTGRYPSTQEGLKALMEDPGIDGWDGPYLRKAVPKDPWKNPYNYVSPGQHGDYDLISYGKDKAPDGTKENQDIVSWQ
jgi:general secretion pathway protein G